MNYNKIAADILEHVGGKENVKDLVHCFTRLRFTLKDVKKADKDYINTIEGVISVVYSGGQFQVVLGNKVEPVFNEMITMVDLDTDAASTSDESGNLGNRILSKISAIFTPMIPAIAASGLLKGILAIAKFYVTSKGGDITISQTYIFLNATSDVIFYFMPIILAYASAKVFKTNEYIAMVLGGTMCYPALVGLMTGSDPVSLFGIGITKASYTSSVIPILIGVFFLSYVEKFLKKYIPEVLRIILVPSLSLLIMVPATYLLFGPIGIYIGNGIIYVYQWLLNISPILTGAFLGGLWGVLVIFGAHRALLPIGINDVANHGRQNLLAFAGAANFAQGGAALGVFFKTKNKDVKTVALSACISASVAGITEPAIYGTNLKYKKPMLNAIIFGAIGGAIMGAGGAYGNAFANNGILTIPVYLEAGTKAFIAYLLGITVAFFGAAIGTYVMGFKEDEPATKKSDVVAEVPTLTREDADIVLSSPVSGKIIPQASIGDEVFSSNAMGKGYGVYPTNGSIIAPEDGELAVLYPTLHAMVLKLESGVELLIHIGVNTGELNGKHFEKLIEQGSKFKKGDTIVNFDLDALSKDGYDTTVIVIVSNVKDYNLVETKTGIDASTSTDSIYIKR